MIDIHATLAELAQRRPMFHSEADFQHAVAWDLHVRFPTAGVRLERPIRTPKGLLHVDLVADFGAYTLVAELKYKTRAVVATLQGEDFALRDHAAQPISRYEFLKDVTRLESIQALRPKTLCWAILLTNDSAYWFEPKGAAGISADFTLCDGRECSGTLKWGVNTSASTMKGREAALELSGRYRMTWRDYATVAAPRYARFRYLAVEVRPSGAA